MIKKIIISLLISILMLNIYNYINQNNYTVQAGIKKGSIQKDFSYTQNVQLPDFTYDKIVSNRNVTINNSVVIGSEVIGTEVRGGHFPPYYEFRGYRNAGTVTTTQTSLNYLGTVFVGVNTSEFSEGDVTIVTSQNVYERQFEQVNTTINTDQLVAQYVEVRDPIVVDLDGNGKPDVSQGINTPHNFFDKSRAVLFDINADGVKDLMEWIGPNDGLLIFFKNDKFISDVDGFNLMSNAYGFVNGYEKMFEMFDFNKDRILDKSEISQMYIWQDKNQDTKVQKDELITLEQLGIEKIVLSYGENKMESVMYKKDGSIVKTWQWWPSVYFGIGNK
jgi:hypothetical protein